MNEHRRLMEDFLKDLFKTKTSPVLSEDRVAAIRSHLLHPEDKVDPKFKHWCKQKNFKIIDLPDGFGPKDVLVIPKTKDLDSIGSNKFLRVTPSSEIYDIILQVHAGDPSQHIGYKKVLHYIHNHYYGITRSYVQTFCKTCPTCHLKQSHTTKTPPLKPTIEQAETCENEFLQRIQMDLIDLSHSPDGDYHYVAHIMDHCTKYHVLFPLRTKSATEVATMLEERVLAYLGAPRIFHSNYGREFVDEVLHALLKNWNKDVIFVNGLQQKSQGLFESENRFIENKIAAMKTELESLDSAAPWASWLPGIMYTMNSENNQALNEAPYFVAFGVHPPALLPGTGGHVTTEEDLELAESVSDKIDSDEDNGEDPVEEERPISTPRKKRAADPEPLPTKQSKKAHALPISSNKSVSPRKEGKKT